jgi:large subunit ribosomal protein L2
LLYDKVFCLFKFPSPNLFFKQIAFKKLLIFKFKLIKMELQIFKPTSPAIRHFLKLKKNLAKKPVLKKNLSKLKKNSGRMTIQNKRGGHKKRYRQINFNKTENFTGIVYSIEYDPNRNSNIASIFNIKLNSFFYVIAPKDLVIGNIIKSGLEAEKKVGHSMSLRLAPTGCCIFNVSFKSNSVAKISRSAGTYSVIIKKTEKYAQIALSSGAKKLLSLNAFATIGTVSNELFYLTKLGKAGRARWLGLKPTVRGVAMNPVDHPHGGGEGKKSGKRKTPWGKPMSSYNRKT